MSSPWWWDSVHQTAFDNVKATIAKEEIYTDASTTQLGAVITQDIRPIAFFSRKLSVTQAKYLNIWICFNKKAAARSVHVVKMTTYYTIFLHGNNQHISWLDILQLKGYHHRNQWKSYQHKQTGFKFISSSKPSPYVDSGMDLVIFLSRRNANSKYVHWIYEICIESYAKQMILGLQRTSLLNIKISS